MKRNAMILSVIAAIFIAVILSGMLFFAGCGQNGEGETAKATEREPSEITTDGQEETFSPDTEETVAETETAPETVRETEPETERETVPETERETAPETERETEPETVPETERETAPETEPETVPETERVEFIYNDPSSEYMLEEAEYYTHKLNRDYTQGFLKYFVHSLSYPKVTPETPGASAFNESVADTSKRWIALIDAAEEKNALVNGWFYGTSYDDRVAVFMKYVIGLQESEGWDTFECFFFDGKNDSEVDFDTYLSLLGFTREEVYRAFKASPESEKFVPYGMYPENHDFDDPENLVFFAYGGDGTSYFMLDGGCGPFTSKEIVIIEIEGFKVK